MRRRDLIAIIAGIAALPLAAHAQQQAPPASTDVSKCAHNLDGFPERLEGPRWNGWGVDINNSRFQPAAMAGLTPEQVSRLQLKWACGFPGAFAANAQPTIVGGLLFVGGGDRKVYALDAKSGCIRWTFATEAVVRTAISVGPISGTDQFAVFFGDGRASAYAVNAAQQHGRQVGNRHLTAQGPHRLDLLELARTKSVASYAPALLRRLRQCRICMYGHINTIGTLIRPTIVHRLRIVG